jgi:FHS family L-fucose permease-like MFS transporter
MSIVGGAILPAIMGRISDMSSIQTAFAAPVVCYAYVLYFALRGHQPSLNAAGAAASARQVVGGAS